jgi:hypothetical protein
VVKVLIKRQALVVVELTAKVVIPGVQLILKVLVPVEGAPATNADKVVAPLLAVNEVAQLEAKLAVMAKFDEVVPAYAIPKEQIPNKVSNIVFMILIL